MGIQQRSRRAKLFLTSSLAAGVVSTAAMAEAPAAATTASDAGVLASAAAIAAIDDVIVVEGRYLSIDKLNAVKTPTPLVDIPQSLSIIPEDRIAAQGFTDFGDVLRYTPGVAISQGEGHRDAIIIRGNQTTADFFIDGLRDDVQYFRPFYNLEQIEILRGSNALLFGRGGGGGVINRVQKRPEFGEQFVGYTASVDTFGAHLFAGDVNYAIGDAAGFRINAFYEGLSNHRDFFDGERFAVNPTFAFQAGDQTEVVFSYEYVNDDRVVDRGVPSRTVADGPNVPLEGFDNTFFGSPDQNFTTLEAHIVRGRIDHAFTEALRGNITAQYADFDKAYQNLFPSDAVDVMDGTFPSVELDGYLDTTLRQNFIIQGNLVGEFKTGPFVHTLLVGAEYGNQDTANARNDNVFAANDDDQLVIPFIDPLDIPAFGFDAPARDRASLVEFVSVYIQNQIDVTDQIKLVLGGRYDRFDISVDDIFNDTQFARVDNELTPRLGAIYKPVERMSFYFSYSETFLPRSGDQFLTLNLDTESTRPQFFKNTEVGFKWDLKSDLALTAALFDLDRESFTSVDPEDVGQVIVIDGSETRGAEVQLTGNIADWWYASAGYSYLDGRVEIADGSGDDGNRTRQTPEHMFSIWNNFEATERLSIGFGATYQSSYFTQEDNSVLVPDFVRLDAALYYDVSDAVRLQVNIENLLDTDYFPAAHSNNNITTGEPVNARFTISGRF
ncbi:MAG: TonB-dependent siderophore receptor [Pseudomonadota bacterium]